MSRTFRRQHAYGRSDMFWCMRDYDCTTIDQPIPPQVDPKSKEGKRRIAKYYSDACRILHREPGPAWYRHMLTERPQRRNAKHQLRRYLKDPTFVVILNGKDPLDYWT